MLPHPLYFSSHAVGELQSLERHITSTYGSALAEDTLAMLPATYSTLLDSHVERILGHVDLWEGSSISIVLHGENKCIKVEREFNVKGRRGREIRGWRAERERRR